MNAHWRNLSVLCSIALIAGMLLKSPSGALLVIPFGTLDDDTRINA